MERSCIVEAVLQRLAERLAAGETDPSLMEEAYATLAASSHNGLVPALLKLLRGDGDGYEAVQRVMKLADRLAHVDARVGLLIMVGLARPASRCFDHATVDGIVFYMAELGTLEIAELLERWAAPRRGSTPRKLEASWARAIRSELAEKPR